MLLRNGEDDQVIVTKQQGFCYPPFLVSRCVATAAIHRIILPCPWIAHRSPVPIPNPVPLTLKAGGGLGSRCPSPALRPGWLPYTCSHPGENRHVDLCLPVSLAPMDAVPGARVRMAVSPPLPCGSEPCCAHLSECDDPTLGVTVRTTCWEDEGGQG